MKDVKRVVRRHTKRSQNAALLNQFRALRRDWGLDKGTSRKLTRGEHETH